SDSTEDVFAFGAIVYELLTGIPPTIDHAQIPTITEVRNSRGVVRSIPPHWNEVIDSCLAKNPKNRPGSIRVAAERLGLDLQSVTWRDPSRSAELMPKRR